MQPSADQQRGQASIEWLTILAVAAVLLTTTALMVTHTAAVQTISEHLGVEASPPPASTLALGEALSGHAGSISLLGARAWLAESIGNTAAEEQIRTAIVARLPDHHPTWLADLTIRTLPSRSGSRRVIAHGTGDIVTRVVTASDEARFAATSTTGKERVRATATELGWVGAGTIARQIARPLGLAVSAVHLVASMTSGEAPQPAGTRADDVFLCRHVDLLMNTQTTRSSIPLSQSWRVGVLRHDELILDTITVNNPCSGPASSNEPAGPGQNYG